MEESQAVVKKKCCFCVPLRVGLLSLAYFNLFLGFLPFVTFLPVTPWDAPFIRLDMWEVAFDREWRVAVQGLLVLPCIIDIAFAIVLLYGLHKSDAMVLYGYMWYAVISMVSTIYICCVTVCDFWYPGPVIFTTAVSVLFQTFIFILVRNFREDINLTNSISGNKLPLYKQQGVGDVESQPQPSAPTQINDKNAVEKTSL